MLVDADPVPRLTWRDRLTEVARLALGTTFCVAVVIGVLYLAFACHERWQILWWLLAEISALTIAYHLYRWWRYPGIPQARTPRELLFQVAGSIAFFAGGIPVMVLLSHFRSLIPIKKLAVRLGLTFRYQNRQIVKVSSVAPAHYHPNEFGIVRGVSVVQRDQVFGGIPLPVGTVVYRLEMRKHNCVDVPEEQIIT